MRYITIVLLIFASQASFAQSRFEKVEETFVGIGAGRLNTNLEIGDNDLIFTAAELIVGYKKNSYLSVDARIGAGIASKEYVIPEGEPGAGETVELKISNYYSLYWRPESANEDAKFYGLFGYSSVSTDNNGESGSESGVSYGAGVGFTLKEDWNLNFEYKWLLDTDLAEFSLFSANVDFRF